MPEIGEIRKVIDWIEEHSRHWDGISFDNMIANKTPPRMTRMMTIEIEEHMWKAKLKEWGLNGGE